MGNSNPKEQRKMDECIDLTDHEGHSGSMMMTSNGFDMPDRGGPMRDKDTPKSGGFSLLESVKIAAARSSDRRNAPRTCDDGVDPGVDTKKLAKVIEDHYEPKSTPTDFPRSPESMMTAHIQSAHRKNSDWIEVVVGMTVYNGMPVPGFGFKTIWVKADYSACRDPPK